MRRVAHPTCDGCGKKNPDFESDLLGIRLCYLCVRQCADWMIRNEVVQENIIATELFESVWQTTIPLPENEMLVWHASRYGAGATYTIVKKFRLNN